MVRVAAVLCSALVAFGSCQASAQGLNNLLNNLLNSGQREQQKQAARDAWSKTDPDVVACMQRTTRPSPQELAEAGVGPSDPRLSNAINQCVRQVNADRTQRQLEQQRQAAEQERQRAQAEARAKAEADRQKAQAEAKAELAKLRSDPALLAVVGKDPRDITALIAGHDTQNVIRNMKGEPTFQNTPVACLPFGQVQNVQGAAGGVFAVNVKVQIERMGGAPISATSCNARDIGRYDLVVFSAGQIESANRDGLLPLIKALTDGQVVQLAVYSVADFETEEQAKKAAADAAEQQRQAEKLAAREAFQARDPATISAIYARQPAPVACILKENAEGLRYLLKRKDSPFPDVVATTTVLREVNSADNLFLSLKKSECHAAVAPTGALRDVVAALTRDKAQVDVAKGFVAADRLAQWKDLANEDRIAASVSATAPATTSSSPATLISSASPSAPQAAPTGGAPPAASPVADKVPSSDQQTTAAASLARCDQSTVATEYYVAACVMRGYELKQQVSGLSDAKAKLEGAGKTLECAGDSMTKTNQMARMSAAKILTSGAISELMDFSDAMHVECKKAAAAVLH